MVKMGCGKCAGLLVVSVLFQLHAVIAQPAGFLNIDCGGQANYTTEHKITWVTDVNYIEVGETAYIGDNTQRAYGSYLHYLRYFPKPLSKSCYQLPVIPNVPYFLRTWFAVGNYTGFQAFSSFEFDLSVETLGMLAVQKIPIKNLTNMAPFYYEKVLVSSGRVLYVCLIRTSENNDPFISAIELRTLRRGMYRQAMPGTMLSTEARFALGATFLSIRYPQDEFDRLWFGLPTTTGVVPVSSQEFISTNNTKDFPPSVVMQTAFVSSARRLELFPLTGEEGTKLLLLLYFAELDPLNITETRSFYVYINNQSRSEAVTLARNYSAIELAFPITASSEVTIVPTMNSTLHPMLNSVEYYSMIDTARPTYIEDIAALDAIKSSFDRKSWISDPCFVIDWDGIGCNKSSSVTRISEINLSERNLTGSIPQSIGQLTALVIVSLENNHLTGPLPNFSNLTKLEILHLQNNNLNGTVPDWLAGLKYLRELYIENNNFSGVIPPQLLNKPSLKIRASGNRLLHNPSHSKKDKLGLILGITIVGCLIIILLLIVGIVIHRKKCWRKESSTVGKESKHIVDEGEALDNSMIAMPNTTKTRAFTLEEIMVATQNFSNKIGQGGFGKVFFGKLELGTDIAVKVLSLFSEQGAQEFLNEIDLLSRVHHKNLVTLLGYCNESKELMLVYEHMSGGSLRDYLYGRATEYFQLNWKTRLKIALDAAQGLEYLHVACTPKIIHRDIKTANILLDKDFNGKLADFGLSRITIDGDASHVTTTVKGTLGYLDPEYFSTHMLTEKSDVYSFGVVLLEIICGRQPINAKLPEEEMNLIRWVTPYVEMDENAGKLTEIIDKRLGRNYDIYSITRVAKLAIRCVQAEPTSRPSVNDVLVELRAALKLEKDMGSLIPDIDMEYNGDFGADQACLSVDSSGPKEMDSAESSSKLSSIRQQG